MELYESPVIFDRKAHTYTLNGVRLSGVTGMIECQLFPGKYESVPTDVLNRAAKHGTLIHVMCELVDDIGITSDIPEVVNYTRMKDEAGLTYEVSEYLVSDETHFASCIDKVFRTSDNTFTIGDIKTTYKLDTAYVSWQLSIYAYLFEKQNKGAHVDRLVAIWVHGEESKLVDVERIPDEEIKKLLQCEENGTQYENPYAADTTLPDRYRSMEASIVEIDRNAKYWADKRKELTDGVMKEMVLAGAYSWKGGNISFTRRKESIGKRFDAKAFQKDHPELYAAYLKETPIAGSITLKIS